MLGPGHLFTATMQSTAWIRFNVAFCGEERLFDFLAERIRAGGRDGSDSGDRPEGELL
jgi:hypothetical protein